MVFQQNRFLIFQCGIEKAYFRPELRFQIY